MTLRLLLEPRSADVAAARGRRCVGDIAKCLRLAALRGRDENRVNETLTDPVNSKASAACQTARGARRGRRRSGRRHRAAEKRLRATRRSGNRRGRPAKDRSRARTPRDRGDRDELRRRVALAGAGLGGVDIVDHGEIGRFGAVGDLDPHGGAGGIAGETDVELRPARSSEAIWTEVPADRDAGPRARQRTRRARTRRQPPTEQPRPGSSNAT